MDGKRHATELLSPNVAGREAAFLFRVTADGRIRMEITDVMVFDDNSKIISMKAYWGPQNITKL